MTDNTYRTVEQDEIDDIIEQLSQHLTHLDNVTWAEDYSAARRYLQITIEQLQLANK